MQRLTLVTCLFLIGCVPVEQPLMFGTVVKKNFYPAHKTTDVEFVYEYDYWDSEFKTRTKLVDVQVPDRWSATLQATVEDETGQTVVKERTVFITEPFYQEIEIGQFFRLQQEVSGQLIFILCNPTDVEIPTTP